MRLSSSFLLLLAALLPGMPSVTSVKPPFSSLAHLDISDRGVRFDTSSPIFTSGSSREGRLTFSSASSSEETPRELRTASAAEEKPLSHKVPDWVHDLPLKHNFPHLNQLQNAVQRADPELGAKLKELSAGDKSGRKPGDAGVFTEVSVGRKSRTITLYDKGGDGHPEHHHLPLADNHPVTAVRTWTHVGGLYDKEYRGETTELRRSREREVPHVPSLQETLRHPAYAKDIRRFHKEGLALPEGANVLPRSRTLRAAWAQYQGRMTSGELLGLRSSGP